MSKQDEQIVGLQVEISALNTNLKTNDEEIAGLQDMVDDAVTHTMNLERELKLLRSTPEEAIFALPPHEVVYSMLNGTSEAQEWGNSLQLEIERQGK